MPYTYLETSISPDVNNVYAGRTCEMWIVPGDVRPTTPIYVPRHRFSVQGSNAKPDEQGAAFSGGGVSAATATVQVVGSTFVAGTINEIAVPVKFGAKTHRVFAQYVTQSGDDGSDIATGLTAVFNAVRGNTAITNGFYRCSNRDATRAQIATAMAAEYAVAAASTDTVTLTAAAVGAGGNFYWVGARIHNSIPSPLVGLTDVGSPALPDVWHGGAIRNFQYNTNPTILDIPADNYTIPFATKKTTSVPSGSVEFVEVMHLEYRGLAGGARSFTYYSSSDILLFDGRQSLETCGLILTSPSPRITGQYDMVVFYEVLWPGGLSFNAAQGADNPLQAQFRPLPSTSTGDPYGYQSGVWAIA